MSSEADPIDVRSSEEAIELPQMPAQQPGVSQAMRAALVDPRLFAPLWDADYLFSAARVLLANNDQRGLWDLDYWVNESNEGRIAAAQRMLAGGDDAVIVWLLAARACVVKNTPRPAALLQ